MSETINTSTGTGNTVLACEGVHHWFGRKKVLFNVNLRVRRGSIVGLVGPSGCGKSTLLKAILGTHPPRQGRVVVYPHDEADGQGHVVTAPGRERGIVYQKYSLFPNLTARENVAFGLMLDETNIPHRWFRPLAWRRRRAGHLRTADELLERLGLGASRHNYPHELSGGMQQRVAIAQALVLKPDILLLDEPFGALDESTREDLQRMLLELYQENLREAREGRPPPHTILLVTHELNEAIFVSDRVLGLSQYWDWKSEGHAECPGATIVYDQPAPVFLPDAPRDYESLAEQKNDILQSTFDPEHPQKREKWVAGWKDVQAGLTEGALKP